MVTTDTQFPVEQLFAYLGIPLGGVSDIILKTREFIKSCLTTQKATRLKF